MIDGPGKGFSWIHIGRLGLVQAAIGAMVMLATSLLNRIMVVEYGLIAAIPAGLVAWHYAVQLARPLWGQGSDKGRKRSPWILLGMAVLGMGAMVAVNATVMMQSHRAMAMTLGIIGFTMIGAGVGAAGTSLLALLASGVAPARRAAAAATTWIMMVAGIVIAAGIAGAMLDPFSPHRLIRVAGGIVVVALAITCLALFQLERRALPAVASQEAGDVPNMAEALAEIAGDKSARLFTLFIFVSMLAYSMQDLILEPFSGLIFALSPGQSTQLSGMQHGGILTGMILVGVGGSAFAGRSPGQLRHWIATGCLGSALALLGLAFGARNAPNWPLIPNIFILGLFNGIFAVAAIGAMMGLAGAGERTREGVRMGVWGAAQAVAFGLGGLIGALGVDVARQLLGNYADAFQLIFSLEGALFVIATWLTFKISSSSPEAKADPQKAYEDGIYDAVVVGGGPAGATAACDLAKAGHKVLLLDRGGRIKPCGGAVPPRLLEDFEIPQSLLVAQARAARMIAPSGRMVDMPVGETGYVGMVDRDVFDEWLRARAETAGAERIQGNFERIERDGQAGALVCFRSERGADLQRVRARLVIGADGARSAVAQQEIPGAGRNPCVFAYHEIIRSPAAPAKGFDADRCDVFYQGKLSPDFYAWVFPHGETASIGVGSANKGFALRGAVEAMRDDLNLDGCETVRREGAPIPLKPLKRWDNGRDVLVAGDAAGVVAPASGEGIYYAMTCGRIASHTAGIFLASGKGASLRLARKAFMRQHGRVFWILGVMQYFWYASDKRRERFVEMCADRDVQQLTWQAYMNKRLVRAKPLAHLRIFIKDTAHLLGMRPIAQ